MIEMGPRPATGQEPAQSALAGFPVSTPREPDLVHFLESLTDLTLGERRALLGILTSP